MIEMTMPPVGSKVKLTRDGQRWWDVRVANERFAILTRQAEFKPKGEVCYTILDFVEGVRGPCNLIGQSWDMYMPDDKCQELLDELIVGAKINDWNMSSHRGENPPPIPEDWHGVEISHRNRVALDVGEVRA